MIHHDPLPLLPHQNEGASFLSTRQRGGLFDEMGVGKTATAIGALDLMGARRIIVICPAAVREVWCGEFKKFSTIPRKIIKGKTIHDLGLWLKHKADVLITSYEMAAKWAPRINDLFDVVIFDEAHYLKSAKALRTRAMLGTYCDGTKGMAMWAAHAWFLTGTPCPNDPIDVWPFLRFTGATPFNLNAFTTRYFKSQMGTFSSRQTPRQEMIEELRGIIGAHSIRRTKVGIGLKLPPVWLTTQTLEGDTSEIRELLRSHEGLADIIIHAVEQGGLSLLSDMAAHIATLRRLVGEAKAPAFVEMLAEELQNGLEKVVVMGVHRKALRTVLRGMQDRGIRAVLIDGDTSENERVASVEAFQNDPAVRVFIGNVRAAGTGLTLTAASDIIMLESSWSPADNAQALMRVHRIGQKNAVRARFISLANSIDEVVSETVARKTAAIASLGIDFGTNQ